MAHWPLIDGLHGFQMCSRATLLLCNLVRQSNSAQSPRRSGCLVLSAFMLLQDCVPFLTLFRFAPPLSLVRHYGPDTRSVVKLVHVGYCILHVVAEGEMPYSASLTSDDATECRMPGAIAESGGQLRESLGNVRG
jgi:hypothetical protein